LIEPGGMGLMDIFDLFDVFDFILALRKNKLSRYEREILEIASSNGGRISIFKSIDGDSYIKIGENDFYDETDPGLRKKTLRTVNNLLRKRFLNKDTETSYSLTDKANRAVEKK
jgi:hypothetical protein